MNYKYQSETFRHGEPMDHKLAVLVTKNFLEDLEFVCDTNFTFYYHESFCKERGIKYNKHTPDLVVQKFDFVSTKFFTKAVIEFDGKTDYEVHLEDGTTIRGKRTRHDTPEQRIRDGIFADYLKEYHKQIKLIRLEKADVFSPAWLRTKLGVLQI